MHPFYESLNHLDGLLSDVLKIDVLGGGLIQINNHCVVDTNQQFEMLSHAFFVGTSANNPTINEYKKLLQHMRILDKDIPSFPLVRDVPMRTQIWNKEKEKEQQALCAEFLEQHTLPNQWSMLFPEEFSHIQTAISECLRIKPSPLEAKKVTTDAEGQTLSSGGYVVEKHSIYDLGLWLRVPESDSLKDIEAAVEKSLNDSTNTNLIINLLKRKLKTLSRIAFNIRGVSDNIPSLFHLQSTDLGGGHVHFLMLDRTANTIYAINDTRNATDEDPQAFKKQIELFLTKIGDPRPYQFKFVQGKSRQADSVIAQPCNISQFLHYAALSAGVSVSDLQDVVPSKVVTLLYLVQYAYTNQNKELFGILDVILANLNAKLETTRQSVDLSSNPTFQTADLNNEFQDPDMPLVQEVKPRQDVVTPAQEHSNHAFKFQCLLMIAEVATIVALLVAGLLLVPTPAGIGLLAAAGFVTVFGIAEYGLFAYTHKKANPEPVTENTAKIN